jgi:hypothetical protein
VRGRAGVLACVGAVVLAGCASGPLGARPELANLADGGEGRDTVTVSFDLRDEDMTPATVRVEFLSGGEWWPATLVSATAGGAARSPAANALVGLPVGPEWTACSVAWDSWADRVAADAEADVAVRLVPSDLDGEGDAAELTVRLNNHYPTLAVAESALSFRYGLGDAANPAGRTISISNPEPAGTTLVWTVDTAGLPAWLSVAPATGTVASGAPAAAATVSVDPVGAGLGEGTHTATVTVSGADAGGAPAHDAAHPVGVTLEVAAPVLEIEETEVTFDDAVEGLFDPADRPVHIRNAGPDFTTLNWQLSISYGPEGTGWLGAAPASGTTTSETDEVVLSADAVGLGLLVGTYTASITVDDPLGVATGRGATVPVTLVVNPPRPEILVHDGAGGEVTELYFQSTEGVDPAPQPVWVKNVGDPGTVLAWWAADDAASPDWLACSPASNLDPGLAKDGTQEVMVWVDVSGLAAGTHTAAITFTGHERTSLAGTKTGDRTVTVQLTIGTPAEIAFDVTSLEFSGAIEEVADPDPKTQSVTVSNAGDATLSWTSAVHYDQPVAAWLAVPASGTVPGRGGEAAVGLTVNSAAAGLLAGTYTARVELSDPLAANSPQSVTVTLHVQPRATLVASPASLDLSVEEGGSVSQNLHVANAGASPLDWSATDDAAGPDWLSVSPASGQAPPGGTSALAVAASAVGLAEGQYQATITLTATDGIGGQEAKGSPATVNVTLTVTPPAIWVDDDGSDVRGTGTYANPYATIGRAMLDAAQGDIVMVKPGTYYESVQIPDTDITLKSEQGADVTVIQYSGEGTGNGVRAPSSSSPTNVLVEGFTIKGFRNGIYAWDGASVRECIFEGNRSTGVFIHYAKGSQVVGNVFRNNSVSRACLEFGGSAWGEPGLAANNLIVNNTGDAVDLDSYGVAEEVIFENNTVAYNTGDGISTWNGGGVTVINSIIAFNGGYGVAKGSYDPATVERSDVYGNTLGEYYDMTDPTGTKGNISQDPLFVGTGDHRIRSSSPCRDAGLNSATLLSEDIRASARVVGGTVDMGCYEWTAGDP